MKKGVLITNLGSPSAATPEALKPYLTQFLMDRYVIDVPWALRFLLVRGLIVPKRSEESAEAYEKVWTDRGSPLVVYTSDLAKKVQERMGPTYHVDFAMRYGEPSFESAFRKMKESGLQDIYVMPLYPQYALATTVSTQAHVDEVTEKLGYYPKLRYLDAFYKDPRYIETSAKIYREFLSQHDPFDHYLFSYHGIPERHIRKTDPSGAYCLKNNDCCDEENTSNRNCYRHHCFQNTYGVVSQLGLTPKQYSVAFQSRLGKDPWIKPYTDYVIEDLAKRGVKRLAVFSPAFVADCLETLEEIGMRGEEDFVAAGGVELKLVPSLNDHDLWADCLTTWIRDNFAESRERQSAHSNEARPTP